jgi:hypothetical protein
VECIPPPSAYFDSPGAHGGVPRFELLTRLGTTHSDRKAGYPRLANYITSALDDTSLVRYPFLHTDVLIYKLDCSYAVGSSKYSSDSVTIHWERATSRLPGEDPISLAVRVTNAFVTKYDSATVTDVTVCGGLPCLCQGD